MVKLIIAKVEEDIIVTNTEFEGMNKGEISHFICELELVKNILIDMWNKE